MEIFKSISKLKEKLKISNKSQYFLIIALVILAVFILIGNFNIDNESKGEVSLIESYVNGLESKLSATLKKVNGAGEVSVIITVESGMETVLATKVTTTVTENKTETVETPILVNGKTVVLKELYPKVKGVLIVAEGASNLQVLSKLQQATLSLLDININQIEILTMK